MAVNDGEIDQEGQTLEYVDADDESLFDKNMKMFEELMPGMHKMLLGHKPISSIEYLDNDEPSIRFQDKVIYPEGAVTEVRRQLDDYRAHSTKFTMDLGGEEGLDPHSRQAYRQMRGRIDDSGLQISKEITRNECYFLVVFGVGLGHHIEELVEKTRCRVLLLVEPNMDLMYHSLSFCNWGPLLRRMKERGNVDFFLGTDPQHIATNIKGMFRHYNPIGYDGATLFRHYRSFLTDEIERELIKDLATSMMGLGFFTDEINMIAQTYNNLGTGKARIIEKTREQTSIPAIVVGSGPSLDELIPFIRKNKERAIIFASGSALINLFENDIVPDFWVVVERVKATVEMAEQAQEIRDTSDIRMLASSTVFPKTTQGFKESIFYFRPGLAPAPLFTYKSEQIVRVPDPLAANAGLACALHMGFRECYLVGVDVGSKVSDRAHAKGGYYTHNVDPYQVADTRPGNFGGIVYTAPLLDWSRTSLETLANISRGRMLYNLSDGALIKGITPLHHRAARLKPLTQPREQLLDAVVERCPIYSKEIFVEQWEKAAIVDRMPTLVAELKRVVNEDSMLDFGWAKDIAGILITLGEKTPLARLVRGTIFSFCLTFEWTNNRLVDPNERDVLIRLFRDEYSNLLDVLQEKMTEQFLNVENGVEWDQFEE